MHYSTFHIIHLFFLFVLIGSTFAAFAAPVPENRSRCLMWSGIASVAVLMSGMGLGMFGIFSTGVPGWIWVKLVCWLLIAALAGIAFRKPKLVTVLLVLLLVLVATAISMVSLKPL